MRAEATRARNVSVRWIVLAIALMAVPLGTASVAARQPPPPTSAAQEGFVPVDQLPKAQDTIPAPRLVAAAYGFAWLAVFGYLWSIWRRLSTVERELDTVSRRLEPGSGSS